MTRQTMRLAFALMLTVGSLFPASAEARSCPSRSHKAVVARGPEAMVFRKAETGNLDRDRRVSQYIYYGCHFKTNVRRRLNDFTDFDQFIGNWRFSGRYLAFTYEVEDGADSTTTPSIVVRDLRIGERAGYSPVTTADTMWSPGNTPVYQLVSKRTGSIAWASSIERRGGASIPTEYQIHAANGGFGRPGTMLEDGTDIDPRSLMLSNDRRTIHWTKGGEPRSAPLR